MMWQAVFFLMLPRPPSSTLFPAAPLMGPAVEVSKGPAAELRKGPAAEGTIGEAREGTQDTSGKRI